MGTRFVGPISQVLELNSAIAGRLQNVDHGFRLPNEVDEPVGLRNQRIRTLPEIPTPEPIFSCGAGMTSAFYKWLQRSWAKEYARPVFTIIGFSDVKRFV